MEHLGRCRCSISEMGMHAARMAFVVIAIAVAARSEERPFTVSHGFSSEADAPSGSEPRAGLALDPKSGNIYGTTILGGENSAGVIYRIDNENKFHRVTQLIHPKFFGSHPNGLVLDKMGNLYGTTYDGGFAKSGAIFEYSPTQKVFTVIYTFQGGPLGSNPVAALVLNEQKSTFYGTTLRGGGMGDNGEVFEISTSGNGFVPLHLFTGGSDGGAPAASLIVDSEGNIYGTTMNGGLTGGNCGTLGCGVVFKIQPTACEKNKNDCETVLYSFTGGADGGFPVANLTMDKHGNLYGTTLMGGNIGGACGKLGCGVVFKLEHKKQTALWRFNGRDGKYPQAGLVFDSKNKLYGTTTFGGDFGKGTIFKLDLSANGTKETVVHPFTGGHDGKFPVAGVLLHHGYLYSTASEGGSSGSGPLYKCCRGTVGFTTP